GIRDGHVTGVQTCALPIFPIPSPCAGLGGFGRESFWTEPFRDSFHCGPKRTTCEPEPSLLGLHNLRGREGPARFSPDLLRLGRGRVRRPSYTTRRQCPNLGRRPLRPRTCDPRP